MNCKGSILKKLLVVVGVLALVIVGGVVFLYKSYVYTPEISVAMLQLGKGATLVGDVAATDQQMLYESDVVKTDDSGESVVIIHGTVNVQLSPNTTIALTDLNSVHPQIELIDGDIRVDYFDLGDVTGFSVKEGNNLVTAVGTVFRVSKNSMTLLEGAVEYTTNGKTVTAKAGDVVRVIDGNPTVAKQSAEEKNVAAEELGVVKKSLQEQRAELLEKNQLIVNQIKKKFDISDEQIASALMQADKGELDIDSLLEKMPIVPAVVQRVADITREIQEVDVKE